MHHLQSTAFYSLVYLFVKVGYNYIIDGKIMKSSDLDKWFLFFTGFE